MLKLKESVDFLKERDTLVCHFTSLRKIRKYEASPLIFEMLNLLKEPLSEEEFIKRLAHPSEEVLETLQILKEAGLVIAAIGAQDQRLKRQLVFLEELTSPEEAVEKQKAISDAIITVVGVGAVGSLIVHGLYQLGVKEMRVIDPDTVEISNLNRQTYFINDLGKDKVQALQERYPDCKIMPYKMKLDEDTPLSEIIRGSSLVVNCADSPSVEAVTRLIANVCTGLGIPYSIAGGYNMHTGMVGPIFIPGETHGFEGFLAKIKKSNPFEGLEVIKEAAQTGSIGPMVGVIANLHLLEVFKFLIGRPVSEKYREIDFMDFGICSIALKSL